MKQRALRRSCSAAALALVAGAACESQEPPQLPPQRVTSSTEPASGRGSGRGKGTGKGDKRGAAPIPQSKYSTFQPLSAGELGSEKLPGYRHVRAGSKFRIGAPNVAPAIIEAGAYTRYVGSEGAFLELSNGFGGGVPNAGAPSTQVEPYSNEPTAHTRLVLNYFKNLGLPQDQLGEPTITTHMRSVKQLSDSKEVERKHLGYTTILHRSIDGIAVADSFAWARFNKNGDVVTEQVWWPELPTSILAAVAAFRTMLQNSTTASAFRNKLPPALQTKNGAITIHHSVPIGEFWQTQVTYDISDRYDIKSFDVGGNPIQLVSWSPAPSSSK